MPVTYTLKFELSSDITGSGDTTTCQWFAGSGASLGTFGPSVASGGGAFHWTLHSVDVTDVFSPYACELRARYFAGADWSHFRNVRVEGSDGSVYYGEYVSGSAYTSGDAPGHSFDGGTQIAESGGATSGLNWQWNKATGTPSTTDTYVRFFFTLASPTGYVMDFDLAPDTSGSDKTQASFFLNGVYIGTAKSGASTGSGSFDWSPRSFNVEFDPTDVNVVTFEWTDDPADGTVDDSANVKDVRFVGASTYWSEFHPAYDGVFHVSAAAGSAIKLNRCTGNIDSVSRPPLIEIQPHITPCPGGWKVGRAGFPSG